MDDRAAIFERLLAQHGPMLRTLVGRLCGRADRADDVWQETALRVWRALERHPDLRDPKAWLATLAWRAWADTGVRRSERSMTAPVEADIVDPRSPEPGEAVARAEEHDRVRTMLARLPEEYRVVVALHYTVGFTLNETAETLGVPVGTAKSRLARGLELLRKELA